LHLAIEQENRTAVEELLKRDNVDVNLKNNYNQTALHYASCWKNMPIHLFRIILEKSADVVNAQDKDGNTALHWATFKQSETQVEELLKRDDVMNVNLKNNDKQTALHLACAWKNIPIDLFKKILKKSTDVNAQDKYGWTALHWA
ncbi:hypothetical protein DAPPUDRAFT_34417, partial [Daphnia pulex]